MQRLTDAGSLLSNLGQIGSITGDSLGDLAKKFGIPLDKFAQDLGITQDALGKQYQQAELQAQAAIKANEYLANILEVLEGRTPDHSPFVLGVSGSVSGTKPIAPVITAPTISL